MRALLVCTMAAAFSVGTGAASATLETDLAFRVVGQVAPACSVDRDAGSASLAIQDPATGRVRAARVNLPFTIDCNTAFAVEVVSQNGGLKFQDGPVAAGPAFLRSVAYNIDLTTEASAGGLSLTCDSPQMAERSGLAGCNAERPGDTTHAGSGAIALTVAAADGLLLAGEYQDQLTLRITPRIGGEIAAIAQ
jgi:hypothetical protein